MILPTITLPQRMTQHTVVKLVTRLLLLWSFTTSATPTTVSINQISINKGVNKINTLNSNQPISQTVTALHRCDPSLDKKILTLAVHAYYHAKAKGEIHKPILTLIDYSRQSKLKRLWVFDIPQQKLLFHTYVSHGKGSGGLQALHFSNQNNSHQSSLGCYITGATFYGKHGLSLRLIGKEPGFNDHARARAIVMHGAWYANNRFIQQQGYTGRSWGCPAIPTALTKTLLPALRQGSFIIAYYPDQTWLSHSKYL
jgi:L,D-transpeptidase catalytic domain